MCGTAQDIPEKLSLRAIRANWCMLASTLLDVRTVLAVEVDWLYRIRWDIEANLRSIKAEMSMDILRWKSPVIFVDFPS